MAQTPDTAPTPGTAAPTGTPASDPSKNFDTMLKAEQAARKKAEDAYAELSQRHANLQTLYGRQTSEVGRVRREDTGVRTPPSPFREEPEPAPYSVVHDPVYEADRKRREIADFRRESGLDPEKLDKVMKIASDPLQAGQFIVYDEHKRIDFYRSYQGIADSIELSEFRAARAKAAAEGGAGAAPTAPPRSGATMSPSGATTPVVTFDPRSATANEILQKGGLPYDPNDPPEAMKR